MAMGTITTSTNSAKRTAGVPAGSFESEVTTTKTNGRTTEPNQLVRTGNDSSEIVRALARAEAGEQIAREDALSLMHSAETGALLEAASSLRNRVKGRTISYSRKVFIPLTTLCRAYCGYCTFRRDPGEPGGRYMAPEEVLAAAERARAAGCKELLFSLGDQPERIFPEARAVLSARSNTSPPSRSSLSKLQDCSRTQIPA